MRKVRRKHADELREERAARARKNDSLLGRVQNTAISTATREVTRQVTRGILGGITGLFGGKQEVIIDIHKAGAWSLKLRAPAFFYTISKFAAQADGAGECEENGFRVTPHQ